MSRAIAATLLSVTAILVSSCGTTLQPRTWNQLHADTRNSGFNPVRSGFAEPSAKRWSAPVGQLAFSSPAVGPDGTVNLGNVSGRAVAINPDGTERWRIRLGSSIVATPAVDMETGDILFVVQHPFTEREYVSFLYRISSSGHIVAVSTEQNLTTTSAPKIWRNYVFLQTGVRRGSNNTLVPGQVYVFDRVTLQLVAKAEAKCIYTVCAGGFDWFWGIVSFLNCVVQLNTLDECFPPHPLVGPIQEPSVAIADGPSLVVDPDKPIVVATTGFCAVAFRFNPLAAPDQRLEHFWNHKRVGECDDPVRVTSPALIVGTQVIFGDEKGVVKSLDLETGNLFWKVELNEAVKAPPVAFLRQIYLVTQGTLTVLDSDGAQLQQIAVKGTGEAAALSLDYVYVVTTEGIHTFRLNPADGSSFDGSIASTSALFWAVSGLALARDGTLYVSARDGFLHAYGPGDR